MVIKTEQTEVETAQVRDVKLRLYVGILAFRRPIMLAKPGQFIAMLAAGHVKFLHSVTPALGLFCKTKKNTKD